MPWDFSTEPEFEAKLEWMRGFVREHVWPLETLLDELGWEGLRRAAKPLQDQVSDQGLWAAHLEPELGGQGFGQVKLGLMHEILGSSPIAPLMFGNAAPDSGNSEVLAMAGTPEQKDRYLHPLLAGDLKSGFSMTEPDSAGSDPTLLKTRAVRNGDDWVINGHKWFTSNGRRAAFAIVVCRTEDGSEGASARERMTQIIVPTDTPGFNIVRSVPVWGHEGGDHCEILYENVRVPLTNQIGRRGSGHQAAQDRLGAGRVFHCMNCVGQMWRAFDLMAHRAINRQVHGGALESKQFIQGFLADSYIDIQAARLMTINTAHKIDTGIDARTDISAIKIFVPEALSRVVDRAIQVHGALGVSSDTPLEGMYRGARTLRIADGPDEVHRIVIAKNVLRRYHEGMSWDFGV
jgi:acyl-CoA dehydrogenase